MKDLFEGFGATLKELDPRIQKDALVRAKRLMKKEGYDKETALKQAIQDAEQLFFDSEG